MKPSLFLKKLIGYEEIYTIAYRDISNGDACFTDGKAAEFNIWEDLREHWYADPMLFQKDGVNYLFFEMYNKKKLKGSIGVSKFDGGRFSAPQTVIDEAFHMSYPYVFEIDGGIYMLPETSEAHKLIFYRCAEFPFKWERHTEIDTEQLFVDTNIIQKGIEHYIFCSLLDSDHYKTMMHIEKLSLESGKFSLSINKDLHYNSDASFETRNGGRWFEFDGKMLRPSQVSKPGLYGYSLKFFEPFMEQNSYDEKCLYELKPEQIIINYNGKKMAPIGIHTYGRGTGREILDVKLLSFNSTKWIDRLLKHLRWDYEDTAYR